MPHMQSPVPRSSLELTEPHCNHCWEPSPWPIHPYWSVPWWRIRQKHSPLYSPYRSWTNRLMSLFHKEFPAAIFFVFRLQKLATNPRKASALPGLSGGWPAVLAASTLSLPFVVNELTHFCDTLCLVILFKPSLGSVTEWRLFTLQSFFLFFRLFFSLRILELCSRMIPSPCLCHEMFCSVSLFSLIPFCLLLAFVGFILLIVKLK